MGANRSSTRKQRTIPENQLTARFLSLFFSASRLFPRLFLLYAPFLWSFIHSSRGFLLFHGFSCPVSWLGSLLIQQCDIEALTAYPGLSEVLKYLSRHTDGQIDQAVFRLNIDMTDVLGIEPCLIGNGTNDIARFDLVLMPHFYAEPLHPHGRPGLALALRLALT